MGAKGDALAKQFEAKAQEVTGAIEKLSDADWKKMTAAEKWSVGVVAHHIASAHESIAGLVKTVADGKPGPNIPMDTIHAMNAKHAQDFAGCTKAETLALHKRGAAAAAATVRGIPDEGFARSGNILVGMPPMTAEQLVTGLLCGHPNDHLASIKATVGH
jgi:hypothetical protein